MIGRKGYILILLFLSWPVDNLHRLLNDSTVRMNNWYPFNPKYVESVQWYTHDVCHAVAYLLILIAIWLYVQMPQRRDRDINTAISALLVIQAIDVIHYIGWHRQCELILSIEGLILIYASLNIVIKHQTHG
jgi:hypothetical protein